MEKEKMSRFDPLDAKYYPPACMEQLHVSTAIFALSGAQFLLLCLFLFTYLSMESQGYFISSEWFRPAVSLIAFVDLAGIAAAVIGALTERKSLVSLQVVVMCSLMVLADAVALSIILIMAIGNRNAFTYHLPHQFVNAEMFEKTLGPFWMYLGAITLHITVAGHMCALQVVNGFAQYLTDKQSSEVVVTSLPLQPKAPLSK